MKTLRDLCLACIGYNLHGNVSCIVRNMATVNKEILIERLAFHDRLTQDYLPHITYNLFSSGLKRINFYGCSQVSDQLLEQLSASKCRLTHLTISKCVSVTDNGLIFITKGQTSLEHIELCIMHQLTSKAFTFLNSPALRTAIIRTCNGMDVDAIQALVKANTGIEVLSLPACKKLNDSVMAVICKHLGTSLKELNLRDLYTLSNKSLIMLANNCPNISRLNLLGCSLITNEGLEEVFSRCKQLRDLDLSYCTSLQQTPPSHCLLDLPLKLCDLSLVGIMFEDVALLTDALRRLVSLKSIRLCGIPAVTDAALDEILMSSGKTLEKLDLSGGLMSPLTDNGIASIARHCTSLKFVGLSLIREVTGSGLLPLLRDPNRAGKLQVLQLSCSKLDPEVLPCISAHCSGLVDLELSGVQSVTDEFLVAISKTCCALSELGIKACCQVTDVGVCALAQYCPLECIVLSGIHNLTDHSVYALANGCPYIHEVYLSGCSRISTCAIEYLKKTCVNRVKIEHKNPFFNWYMY